MTAQRLGRTDTAAACRYRPPAAVARDDPRFARLPFGDDRVVRLACTAATPEAMVLAAGVLRAGGWRVHQVGRAVAAHHPSGRRWIIGWAVGDQCPPWFDRLPGPPAPERAA